MGFDNTRRWMAQLEGGDVAMGPDGVPVQVRQTGVWPQVWPDTIRMRRASEGLAQLVRNHLRDPNGLNFVDFLRPVYGGSARTPLYWDEAVGDADTQSGSRALVIKNVAAPIDIDLQSPVFRIAGTRLYRLSFRWKSVSSSVSQFVVGVDTYHSDFEFVGGHFLHELPFSGVTGTSGAWHWRTLVFETGARARFGVVRVLDQPNTNADIYIDEILLTPVGEFCHVANAAGTSISNAAPTQIPFATTVENYSLGQWSNPPGRWTVSRPGMFQISAQISLANLDPAESGDLLLYKNGAAFAAFDGNVNTSGTPNQPRLGGSISLNLDRGDYVEVFAEVSGLNAEPLIASSVFNWLTINRFGAD